MLHIVIYITTIHSTCRETLSLCYMKQCILCNEHKTLPEFIKHSKSPDGYRNRCKNCHNAVSLSYRQKHRDKINEKQRAYRNEHREEINVIEKIKRANNPKRQRINQKATNKARIPKRKWIAEYLSENPCVMCGERRIACLEFDHLKDKKFTIASMIGRNNKNLELIKQEVAKCQVLCSNCHAIKTAQQFNWWALQSEYQPKTKTCLDGDSI